MDNQANHPAVDLACQLIAQPSVTPDDAGCQQLIKERLQPLGFHCHTLCFEGVTNLWAVHGEASPSLVFAGHTDVVPAGDLSQWQYPPFTPTCKDGWLMGRGSADMKGGVAAMVTALEEFISRYPQHSGKLGLLLTSDEEGDAVDGTVRVMEYLAEQQQHIDWCVIGEPSAEHRLGDRIRHGRRGTLSATLTIHGKQGHVAYPQLAANPIHKALPALHAIASHDWCDGSEFFPPSSLQIVNIESGLGVINVIPPSAQIQFNIRYSPTSNEKLIHDTCTTILEQHQLNYDLQWWGHGNSYFTPPGKLVENVSQAIEKVTATTPQLSTSGGTSDGRFIASKNTEVVEVGLVAETIHQIDERVAIADIPNLQKIYYNIITQLLLP